MPDVCPRTKRRTIRGSRIRWVSVWEVIRYKGERGDGIARNRGFFRSSDHSCERWAVIRRINRTKTTPCAGGGSGTR
jgi:hypothetical protein